MVKFVILSVVLKCNERHIMLTRGHKSGYRDSQRNVPLGGQTGAIVVGSH